MEALGMLRYLPPDVRRIVYGLGETALHLSRVSRLVRSESREMFLAQSTGLPISGKELERYIRRRVVAMPSGLEETAVVVPVSSPRSAQYISLKRGADMSRRPFLWLVGEMMVTLAMSISIYETRGVGRYVPSYRTRAYERVMRRQLETLIGSGLYCTLEDLVGCVLVPGMLSIDPKRPFNEERKAEAERRMLSHFRVQYAQPLHDWGVIASSNTLIARMKSREKDKLKIYEALRDGTPMPKEGRILAYGSVADVERVLVTLDVIRMVCSVGGRQVTFTPSDKWLDIVECRLGDAWQALSGCIRVGDHDRGELFWYSYASTRSIVVD